MSSADGMRPCLTSSASAPTKATTARMRVEGQRTSLFSYVPHNSKIWGYSSARCKVRATYREPATVVTAAAQDSNNDATLNIVGVSNAITAGVILIMSLLQVILREPASLCTFGVILTNIGTKLVKHGMQRVAPASVWRRPEGSRRDSNRDPGFPSSHTSNMTFIAVFFARYLHLEWSHGILGCMCLAIVPSVSMAIARIWDRDHTKLQTFGGLVWGALLGSTWASKGPRLEGMPEWQSWVIVLLCFAVGLPMFVKPLRRSRSAVPRARRAADTAKQL
mmetsp:Transcript_26122/g.60912  ORF Transcript_26122/g.60912 Transcript_26122/m.60912 type:complete len:278 (+) Transcript_26122:172-1005(+)